MNEEKQQKFTAKVRRGLVWVHGIASAELAKKKAEAPGVRIEGSPPVSSPTWSPR